MCLSKTKISFCILCSDDSALLKQTLLVNIRDNEHYIDFEFIVRDFSATTQLEEWINSNCAEYIVAGKLFYSRIKEPVFFNYSSAKNTVFRSATGDIVCFMHPGQYTGPGFAEYINEAFNFNNDMVLITEPETFHEPTYDHPPGQFIGRLCVARSDFTAVNGFDELMIKFGNEDLDLVNRLQRHGLVKNIITKKENGRFIKQPAERAFLLHKITAIDSVYICPLNPLSSEIIFLYKDGTFEKGTLTDQTTVFSGNYKYSFQQMSSEYRYILKGIERKGTWIININDHSLRLQYSQYETFELRSDVRGRYDVLTHVTTGKVFHKVNDPCILEKLLVLNNVLYNTGIMEQNDSHKRVRVNTENVATPLTSIGSVSKNMLH
jgi:hypothetical protein